MATPLRVTWLQFELPAPSGVQLVTGQASLSAASIVGAVPRRTLLRQVGIAAAVSVAGFGETVPQYGPPSIHPDLDGVYDQSRVDGVVVELVRGGVHDVVRTGGVFRLARTGGVVRDGAQGGTMDEAHTSGVHDESLTGGEVY